MKKYGNILFNRRVVIFVVLLFVAINILIPKQFIYADTYSFENTITIKTTYEDTFKDSHIKLSHNMKSPVYSFILESRNTVIEGDKYAHTLFLALFRLRTLEVSVVWIIPIVFLAVVLI